MSQIKMAASAMRADSTLCPTLLHFKIETNFLASRQDRMFCKKAKSSESNFLAGGALKRHWLCLEIET